MLYDVVIVGAGAAGLMAAYKLCTEGKKVLILEARNRVGGRIFTDTDDRFSTPVERGAEFVHGKLPISLSLLRKAGISFIEMQGRSYNIREGKLLDDEDFGMDWDALMKELSKLENDLPLNDFLKLHFGGEENAMLRESVLKFAQGFDAADPLLVSTMSLKNEWMNDHEDNQFRIEGGYLNLMNWLAAECIRNNAQIHLLHIVKEIDHTNIPKVNCTNGRSFTGKKILVTLPLGLWQQADTFVSFSPALPAKQAAARQMGFGNVIKINIEFTERLWETNKPRLMPDTGFIFSDATISSWWTQCPAKTPQINGWLAGPPAGMPGEKDSDEIKELAIDSLSYIFNIQRSELLQKLKAITITNWGNDPFARGGYSFETLDSGVAKRILMAPVNNKLFFAGEALYEGSNNGTVEAAFESGKRAAAEMLF